MKKLPSDPNENPFPLDDSSDRLWEVLGNVRNDEAAPNFVQNVVREARLSADQATDGVTGSAFSRWFAGLLENFQRPAFAVSVTAAAAVAIALVVAVSKPGDDDNGLVGTGPDTITDPITAPAVDPGPEAVESPAASYTVADQLDDIDYLGDLVAVTDPAALNDQMLADLLY